MMQQFIGKKMKKLFFVFAALTLLLLWGCNSKQNDYDKYKQIANQLYEVTCDAYDYDYMLKDGYGNAKYLAGCSCVKVGNYLGRNFDFVAGDAAEIVVRTTAKKDRYASVGMVGGLMWLTSDFMESGLDEDAKKIVPLLLLDGINEKGLVVEINCVNTIDVGGMTTHTNPGKPEISQLCVVKYLLDHAANADEAIELMKDIDIVNPRDVMGLISQQFELHFLIADKDKTYIVEFNNTKPDGEKIVVLEGESVMTNFYLHLADTDKNIYPDNSIGVERYRKLTANKDSVNSLDTMKKLMRSVRFSNSNRTDGEYAPGENYDNPYTCFSDHPILGKDGINYANYKEHLPKILESMERDKTMVDDILKDPKLNNPNGLWVTSHSSVYDLNNKTMSVAVYERFDRYYDYSVK
ncbi:MAG: linear amide C-N hydrolase [Synergistes sp.]|nr:linear amide C-N hydrolase [Synergistes sp.]